MSSESIDRYILSTMASQEAIRAEQIRLVRVSDVDELAVISSLQREIWGEAAASSISEMTVHLRFGGVLVAAYDDGGAVGFSYGFAQLVDDKVVLWSHETAVLPAYADLGVGARIKAFQAEVATGLGYELIGWTFDPLQSRNAYFNLEKLKSKVVRFVPNFYGLIRDSINYGLETDRFVVLWDISKASIGEESECVRRVRIGECNSTMAPVLNLDLIHESSDTGYELEIPSDIALLRQELPELARQWTLYAREAVEYLWVRGYRPIAYEYHFGDLVGRYVFCIPRRSG